MILGFIKQTLIKFSRIILIVAVCGFTFSFVTHISSFLYIKTIETNYVLSFLGCGSLFSFFLMLMFFLSSKEKRYIKSNVILIVLFGLIVYSVFNLFYVSVFLNKNAVMEKIENEYVLKSHGKVIEILTETEKNKYEKYELRFHTSLWMLGYFLLITELFSLVYREKFLFFIKKEFPPSRCEICHQVDKFNFETGCCSRCSN